jgi:2-polyprenyl-3-methyl-5-hydroxy-6-metoxy-1,4-benzoquinol methylase
VNGSLLTEDGLGAEFCSRKIDQSVFCGKITGTMKRNYWENIAPSYDEEIFDVLQNDKKAFIRSVIQKYGSKNKTVIDIGCAIGKWVPVLAPIFKKVYAIDISAKNLEIARQLFPEYSNVEYKRIDMSDSKNRIPSCDFGICINAILTPNQKDRDIFFNSLKRCVKKKGHLVITIPSLESYLLTNIIQQQYKIDKHLFPATKNSKEAIRKWNSIRQGNADIDNVPHKHYLKEELQLLLSKAGFETLEFQKIEYRWSTEFHNPPKWLKEPKPWDWMVLAQRK